MTCNDCAHAQVCGYLDQLDINREYYAEQCEHYKEERSLNMREILFRGKRRKHARAKNNALIFRFFLVFITVFVIGATIGGIIAASIGKTHSGNAESESANSTNDNVKIIIPKAQTFEPLECDLSEDLQEYTFNLCKAYNVDFCVAMGLMYTESGFAADAISGTDDYGLMQINTINAEEIADKLGIYDLTEPHQNIHAGLYLLGKLWKKYKGDRAKVCMAYNMGEYGASQLWDSGIYETEYSKKVLIQATHYHKELEAKQ